MASNNFQEKINYWLSENGFENGFKDQDLQKPLIVAGAIILGSFFWADSSSTKVAAYKTQLLEEKDRGKVISDYMAVNEARTLFMEKASLPASADPREWVQTNISSLASEAGLEVVSSDPGGEKAPSADISVSYWKFVFKGTYHALGSFIYKVESHQPAIGISEIDFARSKEFDAERGAPMEIRAVLFVVQQKISVNAAGGIQK